MSEEYSWWFEPAPPCPVCGEVDPDHAEEQCEFRLDEHYENLGALVDAAIEAHAEQAECKYGEGYVCLCGKVPPCFHCLKAERELITDRCQDCHEWYPCHDAGNCPEPEDT